MIKNLKIIMTTLFLAALSLSAGCGKDLPNQAKRENTLMLRLRQPHSLPYKNAGLSQKS